MPPSFGVTPVEAAGDGDAPLEAAGDADAPAEAGADGAGVAAPWQAARAIAVAAASAPMRIRFMPVCPPP